MNFSENIKDLGLLSELAYLKLEDSYFSDENYSKININLFFDTKYSGVNYTGTGVDNSKDSMLAILDKYDIKHFKSFSSGLQLMILEDKSNPGEYVLSFRGTEFNLFSADITSDFEMALGNETDQMRDALNYVKDLQQNGIKADDGSVIIPPLTEENTTVTGHSLGGALAQYIGYNTGFETYTFNGFGMKKNEATEGKPFSEIKDTSNIHNFYLGIDPVSTFASEIGGYTGGQVYEVIKDSLQYIPDNKLTELQKLLVNATGLAAASIINKFVNEHYSNTFLGELIYIIPSDGQDFWDNVSDHFIGGFNESLALYSFLEKIFETSDIEIINKYINKLAMTNYEDTNYDINVYNNINTNSMPKAIELIYDALIGAYPSENVNYDDISLVTDSLEQIVTIVENNGGITLYSDFVNADVLLSTAKESKGLMYTLINNLSPIIVNNPNYELYQDVDISYMSDEELKDKALMYYHLITIENDTLAENIDFIDYSNNVTTSSNITKETNINTKKVIFGSNYDFMDENLTGFSNDDRIYGNAGNDTIEAGAGINYIDGGTGSDTISYKNSSSAIKLNLSLTTAQTINSTTTDTIINVENVIGSKYADNITGKANSNSTITLDGGDGNDILKVGLNSVNKLFGGAGDDTLVSTLIGFKNESAGIDYSKGSSYLNGGEGFDTYVVKDYVTIEDDDGLGEIETKYGKLQDLTIKTLSNGTILLLKNNPIYIDATTTSNPFAGYSSGAFNTVLGNFGTTTTQGMSLDNYELIFKLQKDGNDLILNDLTSNPTVIRIKNYTANSLNLNISQTQFDNLPAYSGDSNSPSTPVQVGSDEAETLVGSEVNNTYTSNKGDDTIKDTSGGNDIYKFKKGDGNDIVYDIKGDDTILFDETVIKSDITFLQSEDLKSLIIKYSQTDSITIQDYFDSFSKIENIELSTGEKLNPEFSLQTILKDSSVNQTLGYGNDEIRKVA